MTLVVEVTNMLDATGEDEFKDYPVVFTIGMVNKNIHASIDCDVEEDETRMLDDVISYYGMNCYLDDVIFNMDTDNKKLRSELSIEKACVASYENRFNKKQFLFIYFRMSIITTVSFFLKGIEDST